MNYYQASPSKPFHLSVGAIVIDENGNILCEHYDKLNQWEDIYTLMHNTVRPNESLEQAIYRGLKEEMGIIGEVLDFVGVVNYKSDWFGEINQPIEVTKSIAYFTVRLISINEEVKDKNNSAYSSKIATLSRDDLIIKMQNQLSKYKHPELDESSVL